MSNNDTQNDSPPQADMPRARRASVTSAAFTNLFQRSNSTSQGTNVFPGPITTAAMNDQRRRLSISTLGLSGTSPTTIPVSAGMRRGSISTNSDSIDENAIEEDDAAPNTRTAPTTPFARRMSFGAQAMRTMRTGGATSPGSGNGRPSASNNPPPPAQAARRASSVRGALPTPPGSAASSASASWRSQAAAAAAAASQASPANTSRSASDKFSPARTDQGFNWSEQLRSRAESSVTGSRPSFSFASGLNNSPPRPGAGGLSAHHHDRAKSVSDMPAPPAQAAAMKPRQDPRPKPDHFQERILKGDFYMD
ncbi:uncharacterized protein E0L32_003752 [Thyridium curvatum]|uniref:Uncharacterized protein n=1 Tax=Thyridium curvatum TaxID=1093900 RepID=A0A507BIG9_9PEZI|nr:uncharacterized protein E0L32_003752 [Thyridium curvatum]TPX16458.1 hypothetical protein E0L32_003752 [Thyridium curvatum]